MAKKIEGNAATAEENASFGGEGAERLWKAIFLLRVEVTELKAAVAALSAKIEPDAEKKETLVEVVQVPPPDIKAQEELIFGGKRCLRKKDDNGYYHFLVPPAYASGLLTNDVGSGTKFYLIGDAPLKMQKRSGRFVEDVEVLPHGYDGKEWKPVK
jgi:hypothetical protein